MRLPVVAIAATAAALVASSALGVASAEAPLVTATRSVSVGGVSVEPIAQGANAAAATAVYRQAMAAAVVDGQAKAQFLAEKTGVTIGPVQSIAEGSGSIGCSGGDETNGYAEYEGEQPDFSDGSAAIPVSVRSGVAAPVAAPTVGKAKKHRKHKHTVRAKRASVAKCTLRTGVALVYAIG